MMNVKIYYSPFSLDEGRYTRIIINGSSEWFDNKNNKFTSFVIRKPIEKWLLPYTQRIFSWPGFLPALISEINEHDFLFSFCGLQYDFLLFEREVKNQVSDLSADFNISFDTPSTQDYLAAQKAMRKILVMIRDTYRESEALKAIALRKKLDEKTPEPQSKIFLPSREDNDNYKYEPLSPVCIILDSNREIQEQMISRMLKILDAVPLRALRCYVVATENNLSLSELSTSIRSNGFLPPLMEFCLDEADGVIKFQTYIDEHYYEEIYRPSILGQAADFIAQIELTEASLQLHKEWMNFCRYMGGIQDDAG